jgi:hypothetical protein
LVAFNAWWAENMALVLRPETLGPYECHFGGRDVIICKAEPNVMQDQRDELVMELVLATLEQTLETREIYLRSACGDDSDLLAEVAERVLWEERMAGFLTQSVIETLKLLERPFESGDVAPSPHDRIR